MTLAGCDGAGWWDDFDLREKWYTVYVGLYNVSAIVSLHNQSQSGQNKLYDAGHSSVFFKVSFNSTSLSIPVYKGN